MEQETILQTRKICLNGAIDVVIDKHTGQRTDIKVYNQEILTLATSFEEWFLRKILIKPVVQTQQPVAQPQKAVQQPPLVEPQTAVHPVAQTQEPPINKSPMQDQIETQRKARERFAEDFAIDKFKQEPDEKLAIQKGLGFTLKK